MSAHSDEKRFTGCSVRAAFLQFRRRKMASADFEMKCVETGLNFSLQIDRVPDHNRAGLGGDANPLGVRPAGETQSRALMGLN